MERGRSRCRSGRGRDRRACRHSVAMGGLANKFPNSPIYVHPRIGFVGSHHSGSCPRPTATPAASLRNRRTAIRTWNRSLTRGEASGGGSGPANREQILIVARLPIPHFLAFEIKQPFPGSFQDASRQATALDWQPQLDAHSMQCNSPMLSVPASVPEAHPPAGATINKNSVLIRNELGYNPATLGSAAVAS